jgi:hypothetical protein
LKTEKRFSSLNHFTVIFTDAVFSGRDKERCKELLKRKEFNGKVAGIIIEPGNNFKDWMMIQKSEEIAGALKKTFARLK